MNKEFIPYEQALELKELGFDEPCFGKFYTKPKCKMFGIDEKGRTYPIKNTPKKLYTIGECCVLNEDNVIIAPLYQQAFRWFRDKFNLKPQLTTSWGEWDFYIPESEYNDIPIRESSDTWTYEDAELACLIKLIEIVKKD
jgi:hypothetical protein